MFTRKVLGISKLLIALVLLVADYDANAQQHSMLLEPADVLSADFHAGRREAFRQLMPANSVALIFAYPERIFSKDVNYNYHQNPDLYYLSGYKEPDAVLLIFKEMQQEGNDPFNELLFVRKRDALKEQWTGRRLGVEGAKEKLGFKNVYTGDAFAKFPIDFKSFNQVLFDVFPDDVHNAMMPGDLQSLLNAFKLKANIPVNDNSMLQQDIIAISTANSQRNLQKGLERIAVRQNNEAYRQNTYVSRLLSNPDSTAFAEILSDIKKSYGSIVQFNHIMSALREIKTPEELQMIRRSVEISSIAQVEAMKAITPQTSEKELEGLLEYIHKKYGAEGEGYPPIVGAGQNGCILHYIENSAPLVNNQLVLMDVGSEYRGYSADVTRTIPASGKFTAEQKAIYQVVYDAQEEVLKLCKAGVPFGYLNEKAKEVLANGLLRLGIISNAAEVSKYYMHGVSHHMGLDVHDRNISGILKENMVITVEPGIYISKNSPCDKKWWDIAVRIEDDVRIGTESCELMSAAAPRTWQDIEKVAAEKSAFNQLKLPALSH